MLSPAVRAAAARYDLTTPLPQCDGWMTKARVDAYLVGYAAGYVAPKSERFPLGGDQAFKRLLGQYFAENIPVYHPRTGRYGRLMGLPACSAHDGEPFADVEFYADAEAREAGCGDLTQPVSKLLPVLYGFSALCDPLPDGTVPAVEVAKLAGYEVSPANHLDPDDQIAVLTSDGFICMDGLNGEALELMPDGVLVVHGKNKNYPTGYYDTKNMASYFYRHHFAVGLEPHQYHRRVPGFDYASGGKPSCGSCPGCEAGKEVGCG